MVTTRKGVISHSDLWQWNVDCSRDSASCELILCSDIHYQRLKNTPITFWLLHYFLLQYKSLKDTKSSWSWVTFPAETAAPTEAKSALAISPLVQTPEEPLALLQQTAHHQNGLLMNPQLSSTESCKSIRQFFINVMANFSIITKAFLTHCGGLTAR